MTEQATVKERMKTRARVCWVMMDRNEKSAVRIGVSPSWVMEKNLGEKNVTGFSDLSQDGDALRELTLALIALTNGQGKGMLV